jgi:hypothetical protein
MFGLPNIFLWQSKSTVDKIFGMKHLLVNVLQVCLNKCSRVKNGRTPGVIDIPYMYIEKIKRIFL